MKSINDENHEEVPDAPLHESKEAEAQVPDVHPVAAIIDGLIHKVLDIEDCAHQFVTLAQRTYRENAERLIQEAKEIQEIFEKGDESQRLDGVKRLLSVMKDADRHTNSNPRSTLERSLFIYLFSIFDSYIGNLISVFFEKKPELYNSIDRQIQLSDALQLNSIEELRAQVLEKEIESVRRKSYVDQFKELERIFAIKLTAFDQWPRFIENTQRRNLFTHCDGIVSEQYLKVCRLVGYKVAEDCKAGDQLGLGSDYFFNACKRVTETAIMLGQVIWRKLFPEEILIADNHLHLRTFSFLEKGNWNKAISLCEFSSALPIVANEKVRRINTINHAIALRASGYNDEARRVLENTDWSASSAEFRLAYTVLIDDYEKAAEIMEVIGRETELIDEVAYHEWPLFREFRESEQFLRAYEKVYGYRYEEKVSRRKGEANREDGGGASNGITDVPGG